MTAAQLFRQEADRLEQVREQARNRWRIATRDKARRWKESVAATAACLDWDDDGPATCQVMEEAGQTWERVG